MFASFERLPDDPILGLTVAYNNDTNPNKIDLGAGVYKTEDGNTPIFAAVKKAEAIRLEQEKTKAYTGIQGDPVFCEKVQPLILGENHPGLQDGRSCAISTPGGSGGLRVAAEIINKWKNGANLWVSTPTWANHIPLLGTAGCTMQEYPYYDHATRSIKFDEMAKTLSGLGPDDVVLLHGCCHNPTGADLNKEQWQEVAKLAKERGFIPFVDFAYQGLGDGLDEDATGARLLAESVPEVIITYSCSKNFGLYRDRIGALLIQTAKKEHTDAALSHLKRTARRLYSVPPAHGAIIVGHILSDAEMTKSWKIELNEICQRINDLRSQFSDTMVKKGCSRDFSFIKEQKGMFSFMGLEKEQVHRLRDEFSIYMVDNSRVNVAGINAKNIDYLTDAIIKVL